MSSSFLGAFQDPQAMSKAGIGAAAILGATEQQSDGGSAR